MISYAAFGLRLDSDFELPELERTGPDPIAAWRVAAGSADYQFGAGTLLGTDSVYGSVEVRAYVAGDAIRLVYDDTGTFEIRRDDRTIAWHRGRNASAVAMRADLLGRVIAFAAHADGHLALHASAVCIDGRAVALLGPKGAGKSTLALSLVRRGARLITDDTLIVRFNEQGAPWAAPGLQRIRLWEDSARALGAESAPSSGAKPMLEALPRAQRQEAAVPLEACYVVAADAATSGVTRALLPGAHAALACVRFSKLGALAGGEAAAATLERSARLARAIPIQTVCVPRSLATLVETADAIIGWHRPAAMPNASGPQ
jgi:hypothetical protein